MTNYTSTTQSPTLGTLQTVSATPTSTLTSNPFYARNFRISYDFGELPSMVVVTD
jgi:hypothetical protein